MHTHGPPSALTYPGLWPPPGSASPCAPLTRPGDGPGGAPGPGAARPWRGQGPGRGTSGHLTASARWAQPDPLVSGEPPAPAGPPEQTAVPPPLPRAGGDPPRCCPHPGRRVRFVGAARTPRLNRFSPGLCARLGVSWRRQGHRCSHPPSWSRRGGRDRGVGVSWVRRRG